MRRALRATGGVAAKSDPITQRRQVPMEGRILFRNKSLTAFTFRQYSFYRQSFGTGGGSEICRVQFDLV